MMIHATTEVDDPAWVEFGAQHAEATAFHQPSWISVLREAYAYRALAVVVTDDAGKVCAGAPVLEIRSRLTGNRGSSLPFSDVCPPLGTDRASLETLTAGLEALRAERGWQRVDVQGPLPPWPGVQPGRESVRHETALAPDPAGVISTFRSSTRRLTRQAEASGLSVRLSRSPDEIDRFYELHLETRRRLGVPVQPRRFFRLLAHRMLPTDQGFLLFAEKGQRPVAGAFFLTWKKQVIYKYGASDADYWELRPNNLLFTSAITWACENGYETFDWGRTGIDDEGLRRFKSGFGATEHPVRYSVVSPVPRQPGGPQRGENLLGHVIRRSPKTVGRVLGELLYRHVG